MRKGKMINFRTAADRKWKVGSEEPCSRNLVQH
jgi:hypothetical protein